MPMHVGGLQLFTKPEGAGRNYVHDLYEPAPRHRRHRAAVPQAPVAVGATGGQWVWREDDEFDIEYHVRHSALPKPGRVRELLELCSRLHSTRLAIERPLWEWHLIEGLRDGRVAMYAKLHHALVDGVSAMRLLQSILSHRPGRAGMPAPWEKRPPSAKVRKAQAAGRAALADDPAQALRTALGISAEAAGLPGALIKTLNRSSATRRRRSPLYAPGRSSTSRSPRPGGSPPRTGRWSGSAAIGKASGTTLNDVVLAMCSGAMRTYLLELDALPDTTLVSMVPVGLKAKESHIASARAATRSARSWSSSAPTSPTRRPAAGRARVDGRRQARRWPR